MFHSSHLIFVKQCFLLTSLSSLFWCYLGSFRFLCLQLVTLQVVSGSHLYGFFLILTMSFQGTIISLYSLLERISRLLQTIVVSATVSACLCMLMREDIIQNLWNKHILILSMYCKNYQTHNLMKQATYYANVGKYLTAFAIFMAIFTKFVQENE